ncbi:MAG: leucine-rich repeat domain-containing protein [Bacteroidales bacterium]|nr:leucine-rich repeat domain-containing protein [Bacteroidales bacterium]
MNKYLHLFLLLFVFSGFANAQSGPQSTANWFGYILPPSPAEYKYVTFTMQNLESASVASDVIPAANTATFANGYVWSVNNDNGYNICRSSFDAANNFIGAPEVMVAGLSYVNDMAYNPADGLIYIITNEHLKSFDPANPGTMQDHGVIEHDGFNMAINMDGDAYMISSWGEFGSLNLSNAQLAVINPIDLPLKMDFDMMTGELFGVHYGNLYQINPNTGAYTLLGALNDGTNSYDPTCLFMTYGSNPTEFTVGDLNYRVNDDNVSVTVTGHVNGYDATGDLIIPASVSYDGNDYTVTVIGNSAFLYCFYLTSLTIPNSVTTIEEGAFAYCSGFAGDLVIPNSVVTIEPSAFFTCYSFDGDLVIGNSVKTIGDYAFNDCNGIHGVLNIPSNVESIGTSSFKYCEFSGMTVDPANPVFDSRDNCNAIIITNTNGLLTGCANTVIPNSVTSIGENAFSGLNGLTSIEIPESVTSIGAGAFSFCFNLTGDLTIPNSVTTIGSGAFFQCSGFDGTLTIGESVTFIGDYAFRQCSNFTSAVSLATTPPELGNEPGWNCVVFEQFGCQVLTVPCDCVAAYQNSAWYDPIGLNGFYEFVEDCSAVSETSGIVSAVYPNPTNGLIKIEAENIQNVSIFNTLGQVIFETSASGDAFEYDFSSHNAGLYFIKVETAKGIETKPVTVL